MEATAARVPLEVLPAYEVVLDHLRREIQLGRYLPGQKFPPERAHAELLGVARVTLREAIRALEGEGYVETRRGATGGVIVLENAEPLEQLRDRLRSSIGGLKAASDFRIANERCTAERAATRITRSELRELERTLDALEMSESIGEFRHADSRFHLGIAEASRSDLLRRAVEDGRAAMFSTFDALEFQIFLARTLRAHRRIFEALAEGDSAKAGRAMTSHLRTSWKELEDVLAEDGPLRD